MRTRITLPAIAALAVLLPAKATVSAADGYEHFDAAIYARAYEVRQMGDLDRLRTRFEVDGEARQGLQDLPRDAPGQDPGRRRDPGEGEAVLRGARRPDGGRDHAHHQRAQPLRDLLLQRPRAPALGAGDRRAHGAALRRDHPRRLLLHELQVRASRSAPRASGAGPSTAWRCWTRRPATSSWPRRGRSTRRSRWSSSTPTGTTTSRAWASTSRPGRRSSTGSTPAPRRATRCAATSTCSRTTATRSSATSRTSARATTRGGWVDTGGIALPRPLRRAALAHPLRQGARDHALRLPPDPDRPCQKAHRAPWQGQGTSFDFDAMVGPFRRDDGSFAPELTVARVAGWTLAEDRPGHRPAGEAGRREELQALPLDGRGLPAQLHGHGRDPDRPAPGVPGRRVRSSFSPRRPRTTPASSGRSSGSCGRARAS